MKQNNRNGYYAISIIRAELRIPHKANSSKLLSNQLVVSMNEGLGAILDSGTTDTYLPRSMEAEFRSFFSNKLKHILFSNKEIKLKSLDGFPSIVLVAKGVTMVEDTSSPIEIIIYPNQYLEKRHKSDSFIGEYFLQKRQGLC